jgi:putative FmdB family regulatory protein
MPTYEYLCTKCGHRFELFQKMSDPPRKRCPRCRGAVRRLIGAGAGILFKGEGFYVTDYRSKDYQDKAKAERETKKPEEKKAPEKKQRDEKTKPSAAPSPERKPKRTEG